MNLADVIGPVLCVVPGAALTLLAARSLREQTRARSPAPRPPGEARPGPIARVGRVQPSGAPLRGVGADDCVAVRTRIARVVKGREETEETLTHAAQARLVTGDGAFELDLDGALFDGEAMRLTCTAAELAAGAPSLVTSPLRDTPETLLRVTQHRVPRGARVLVEGSAIPSAPHQGQGYRDVIRGWKLGGAPGAPLRLTSLESSRSSVTGLLLTWLALAAGLLLVAMAVKQLAVELCLSLAVGWI